MKISPATDLIMLRGSETFTASVTRSDGSSAAMAVTWSSDDPGVAAVTQVGVVTGNASGQTVIRAAAGSQQAQRPLRVIPRYHGTWQAIGDVTSCSADGDWVGICDGFTGGRFDLTATQDRDAVTGELDLGADVTGPVSGTIAIDGRLPMEGSLRWEIEDFEFTPAVRDWESRTTENQTMAGRFTVETRHPLFDGVWRFDVDYSAFRVQGTGSAVNGSTAGGDLLSARIASFVSRRAKGRRH